VKWRYHGRRPSSRGGRVIKVPRGTWGRSESREKETLCVRRGGKRNMSRVTEEKVVVKEK